MYIYIYIFIYTYIYIYIYQSQPEDPARALRSCYFNDFGSLLGVLGPLRHASYHHVKFSLWETLCSSRNDHFYGPCWRPKCKFSLMTFCYFGRMAISKTDFWFFISAICMRNQTMGISAIEDGLFVTLLIFDYLYI